MIDWINFIAGWLGGVAGLLIGHPMDTLKTRQQIGGHSLSTTMQEIYQHEGIRGFYKGFFTQFFTVGPANAIFFFAYTESLRSVQKKNSGGQLDFDDPKWKMNVALAGLLAGTAQVIVTSPMEFVKTLLQTGNSRSMNHDGPKYKSAIEAVRGVYRTSGLLGFYRGFGPTFWRDGASSSIYLIVYESLKPRNKELDLLELITAGGFAGSASWVVILPFDVVKTRLQTDNPLNPKYTGMIDCAIKLSRRKGVKILLKGFWLTTIRAFPVNAALFLVYEFSLKLLQNLFHV